MQQIALPPNGDVVSAASTDQAELVLDDLRSALETFLGFRYSTATYQQRRYYSSLVVEFSQPLEKHLLKIGKICSLLSGEMRWRSEPFNLKMISFGQGNVAAQPFTDVNLPDHMDFSLQRRNDQPYDSNRYFSSMPTSTDHHLTLLEKLEALILA